MDIDIVAFTESARPTLNKLYVEVRKNSGIGPPTASFDTDTLGEHILIAQAGKEIVGFVSAWLPENFIHHLYVYNYYQNRGIGTRLLNAITARLNYPVTLKCLSDNTAAIKFYNSRGWLPRFEAIAADGTYILFELPGPQ